MKTILKRITTLEVKGLVLEIYDDYADYVEHEVYALGPDGSVMGVPSLELWPEERTFWALYPEGTRFLRLSVNGAEEVIDGQVRTVRFRPTALPSAMFRVWDDLLRSIVEDRPKSGADAP